MHREGAWGNDDLLYFALITAFILVKLHYLMLKLAREEYYDGAAILFDCRKWHRWRHCR
jgi:hypothetical protein